ncbi:MAG: alpha-ribazole phosphatase [Muribaculaceae bacterium]|nr:alpha-ribazole phosphatase [Muribaculaceae bacterium]
MIHLTLVRHTSVDVPAGVCYGRTDVSLAPSFPIEAAAVRQKIEGRRFDGIFTSPLSRCVRLAEECGYPEAIPDPRLMEMDFGEWEMIRWDDITDPRLPLWYADWEHVAPTGGESFLDQRRRVADFLQSLHSYPSGSHLLAFAHGGVMMQAMILTGLATPENVFSLQPSYGSVLEITVCGSGHGL